MVRLFLIMILGVYSLMATGQNRPLPPNFPSYEFEVTDLVYTGHYFTNSFELNAETISNMFIMDSLGYVAWYRKDQVSTSVDFKYQAEAGIFTSTGYEPSVAGIFYTYDTELNCIDTLWGVNEERGDTHDFLVLANGNRLIGTLYDTIMDLRGYTFNGIGGVENSSVRGYGIQEFDAEGNLIWNWHSTDFIHPEEYSDGLNYYPFDFDYAHGNALFAGEDGNLIISLRNTSTVYKIDRANGTGEVLWRLGGENSSFTMTNLHRFSAQHYARVLPNGNIGLYDNGNLRWPIQYSRAAEYSLDFSDFTAALEWSYDADGAVFAPGMGNAQWLNDDLVLIGWGYVYRPEPTFTMVNRAGDVVASLNFEDEYMTYRLQAAELPFALPRPYLEHTVGTESVEIRAPEGYEEYIWSTGETTSSITVTENGTYQVWVPHGVGMVGSYPVKISDIVSSQELVEGSIQLFPNPATDQLNIRFDATLENVLSLELHNAAGQMVLSESIPNSVATYAINTSNFAAGLYWLKIRTGDGVLTKKVLLQ
ncbi:MAG: aryl-sulfate sulfotransferase [Bacteroidota bacterium]